MVDSSPELCRSLPGNLSRYLRSRVLLIRLDDNPLVLHTHCLEVFTDLMHDPGLRSALVVDAVAPYAAALGLLHHEHRLAVLIGTGDLCLDVALCSFVVGLVVIVVLGELRIVHANPSDNALCVVPRQPQARFLLAFAPHTGPAPWTEWNVSSPMLGDHLLGRHLWSDSNALLLELLLGFGVDDLSILALSARLLLRVDVVAIFVITYRYRRPFLTILVLVLVGLRGDNVRIVSAQIVVGTYGRRARAYSGR